nr:right-handed parallel beta-helix repeat-containing protein [uncultured Pseudoxanthomonas sp.]
MHFSKPLLGLGLLAAVPLSAAAATYNVGPGRTYTQLTTLFSSVNLAPGDIVEVDGNATYAGNIVVGSDDSGTEASPVTIRWRRVAGATRPVLSGGSHTIKFQQSNHVVFEGFEVTGGTSSCIFSEAHNATVRDAYVHDCPSHGILGADQNSGSFTLEYSEIARSGQGDRRHAIYMQSDEVAYPDTVFRMRYNYVHSATGGVLVRVRHQRAEIHYNWIEGSDLHEVELIGPDCETQKSGWTADLRREDAELVGNVIIHRSTSRSGNALRIGGDLNGRNQGRTRLVNNTILMDRSGTANAVLVQLGQGSLEMHNNVIYQPAAGSAPSIVRENPASNVDTPYCGPQSREPWSDGRKVAGSNNWVQTAAAMVPTEWTGTLRGSDPMFVDLAQRNLRPRAGSPLLNTGNNTPVTPTAFPFPSPQLLPAFDPPLRTKLAIGDAHARLLLENRIDVGAFEQFDIDQVSDPIRVNGSQPLIPSRPAGAAAQPVTASQPAVAAPAPATLPAVRERPRWRQAPAARYRRGVVLRR